MTEVQMMFIIYAVVIVGFGIFSLTAFRKSPDKLTKSRPAREILSEDNNELSNVSDDMLVAMHTYHKAMGNPTDEIEEELNNRGLINKSPEDSDVGVWHRDE